MEENEQKKLGVTIIDGRIIDLDNTTSEELDKVIESLEEKEEKINKQIEELLGEN